MMKLKTDTKIAKALLAAVYFFLIMCSYYMLKPLRDSSFLSEFHANAKPLFNLVTMVLLFFAASFYSSVLKKVQGLGFLRLFYAFVLANLGVFWLWLATSPKIAGAVFYAWLSCANVFLVTIFWTQVNSSFTAKNDKFLYVIIGLGGLLGAAFGGEITENIVPYIGPNNLILAASLVLVIAFFCANQIARQAGDVTGEQTFRIPEPERDLSNFSGLLKNRYAVCLLALVIIGTFVQTVYDYQLTAMVQQSIGKNKSELAVFYGGLYSRLNTLSVVLQVLVGPLVLMTIGPARGMYLLVALILGTSVVLLFENNLMAMEWVFIVFAGSGYSVIQMFREQLYLPASPIAKVSSKGFIDTFGYRVGDSFAAIAFVALVSVMGFDVVRLDYLVMAAGLIAAYYLHKANGLYKQMVAEQAAADALAATSSQPAPSASPAMNPAMNSAIDSGINDRSANSGLATMG